MVKNILASVLFALALGMPVCAFAQTDKEGVDTELANVNLTTSGNMVHVTNAAGAHLEIFNLAGVCIKTINIDSADKSITLNLPKGCYILRVGKTVRKISIR